MRGTSGGVGQVVVTGMRGIVPGAFTVDPGLPQTVDPFQVVQLNATVPDTNVTVDSWVWAAPPSVTLYGSGPSVQYQAPATMVGTTLAFQVTATSAGISVSAPVTHTVRSHSGMWRLSSDRTHLIGLEYRRTPPVPLGSAVGGGGGTVVPTGPLVTLPTRPTSAALLTQGPVVVSDWKTSGDQSSLFTPQTPITRTVYTGVPGTNPCTIDTTVTYQSMLGFGAAVTDSATAVIWGMPTTPRTALMAELFSPAQRGISVVRLPMGASDFARTQFTYDDGAVDPTLTRFSLGPDLTNTVPLLQAALVLNPNLKIIAAPWSPPAWMKTPAAINGGSLNPTYYSAYAQYFVKFVQAYAALGLPIWAVSPQNEPKNAAAYPSMLMTAAEQVTFIGGHLGPAFTAAGLSTRILAYDHNWDDTTYPTTVLADATAGPFVTGVAWHAYAGNATAQTTVHTAYPTKETHFTEITASMPGSFAGDLTWHMREIQLGAPNNWARSVIYWNLALNESNGPINGGYTNGQGWVQVNSTTAAVTRYAPYYAAAHSSGKVQPGAARVSCSSPGTGFYTASAYLNPDGTRVLVAVCDAGSAQTFKVVENNREFTVTMQPNEARTFLWTNG